MALKIRCPTIIEFLRDPGAYFTQKGFHALNCQAICDVKKRVLWLSLQHIGSAHDSRAFKDTRLYKLLIEKKAFLRRLGFFFVGDSAYDLESFLVVPYDDATTKSPEDTYNFWHSNCRIRIECVFREIIMRFGFFWRALKFLFTKSR